MRNNDFEKNYKTGVRETYDVIEYEYEYEYDMGSIVIETIWSSLWLQSRAYKKYKIWMNILNKPDWHPSHLYELHLERHRLHPLE